MDTAELTAARKRLAFVAARRSMLEMERLLGSFMLRRGATLNVVECGRLFALLRHSDLDLWEWVCRVAPVPSEVDGELIEWLREELHPPREPGRIPEI